MLHHASLEIAGNQLAAALGFWHALGFERVDPPSSLAGTTAWVERDGTQIHLIVTAKPTVPRLGHVAVVVPDFAATVARLEASGTRVEPRQAHWGQPRAFASAPGGHRVELMAAPP